MWSQMNVVSNECGLKWMWSQMNVVSNEYGLKWMWPQMKKCHVNVVSNGQASNVVVSSERGVVSKEWSQMNWSQLSAHPNEVMHLPGKSKKTTGCSCNNSRNTERKKTSLCLSPVFYVSQENTCKVMVCSCKFYVWNFLPLASCQPKAAVFHLNNIIRNLLFQREGRFLFIVSSKISWFCAWDSLVWSTSEEASSNELSSTSCWPFY